MISLLVSMLDCSSQGLELSSDHVTRPCRRLPMVGQRRCLRVTSMLSFTKSLLGSTAMNAKVLRCSGGAGVAKGRHQSPGPARPRPYSLGTVYSLWRVAACGARCSSFDHDRALWAVELEKNFNKRVPFLGQIGTHGALSLLSTPSDISSR